MNAAVQDARNEMLNHILTMQRENDYLRHRVEDAEHRAQVVQNQAQAEVNRAQAATDRAQAATNRAHNLLEEAIDYINELQTAEEDRAQAAEEDRAQPRYSGHTIAIMALSIPILLSVLRPFYS